VGEEEVEGAEGREEEQEAEEVSKMESIFIGEIEGFRSGFKSGSCLTVDVVDGF